MNISPRRHRPADEGFTLIELMVVVLIIAILLAVAIPTFLGARNRANDRAAQSQARNALTVELVYYSDNQEFTQLPSDLREVDSSLDYTTFPETMVPGRNIYVTVFQTNRADDTVILGTKSHTGTCFWLRQIGDQNAPRFATTADCVGEVTAPPPPELFGDSWDL